ncbi:hypothetical protein DKX38_021112 [Salix brachista]|uniref:Isopenicillin N synthase-like Fe(2+) 2OG dioxygenase domain-containing protein n=1 Tax=Salix brachista TaxID=2182728 RepID=A0A5N5KBQ9_9ROSI|nr:hypothetical protein DKX38_021112 [Salix brachista]
MYGGVDWKRWTVLCQRGDYTATWRFMEKTRRSARGFMVLTPVNAREVRPVPLSLTVGNARELSLRLPEAMSESNLCLETDYINKALSKHEQHMAINYYPPCPQPELTYGLLDCLPMLILISSPYILLQDDVPACRSVFHRAVVDGDKERISIPAFYCPSSDAVSGPAPSLIDGDHPALCRNFPYSEYYVPEVLEPCMGLQLRPVLARLRTEFSFPICLSSTLEFGLVTRSKFNHCC